MIVLTSNYEDLIRIYPVKIRIIPSPYYYYYYHHPQYRTPKQTDPILNHVF